MMGGFNLPPGCSVSDIPGNRPEELEAEAFADMVDEKLIALGCRFDRNGVPIFPRGRDRLKFYEGLSEFIAKMRDEAYSSGYAEGVRDERLHAAGGEDDDETH